MTEKTTTAQTGGSDWDSNPNGAAQSVAQTGTSQPSNQTPAKPPVTSEDAEEEEGVSVEVELPDDLREAFVLLQAAEAMPERNATEEAKKAAIVAKIRKHVFTLQQGLPILAPDADHMALAAQRNEAIHKRTRIEALARQYPEVKELLKNYDDLRHFLYDLHVTNAALSDDLHD